MQVSSRNAVRFMAEGVPYERLPKIMEQSAILGKLAGREEDQFVQSVAEMLAGRETDLFREISILGKLRKLNLDPALLSLLPETDKAVTAIETALGAFPDDGFQMGERSRVFFLHLAAYLGEGASSPTLQRLNASCAIKNVKDCVINSLEKYLELPESRNPPDVPGRLPFERLIRADIKTEKETIERNAAVIRTHFENLASFFNSDGKGDAEQLRFTVFAYLSSSAGLRTASIGIKRYGIETFIERAKEVMPYVVGRCKSGMKQMRLITKLAAGGAKEFDRRWLEFYDSKNPNSWTPLQEAEETEWQIFKAATLLARHSSQHCESALEHIEKFLSESKELANMDLLSPNMAQSVYFMALQRCVENDVYGDREDEVLEVYRQISQYRPPKIFSVPKADEGETLAPAGAM